jgi:nucleoside-diphosphate-sugar epimerase
LIERSIAAVPNVDVRDAASVLKVFKDNPSVETVWNLAAPLSVETALDPAVAEAVTIGGMRNVINAMQETGVRRICFTDSIGSFGASAPRNECAARWLVENPTQDPGSDYGRQKRGCREMMAEFAAVGGDPRWAVLPGVLHGEAVWGQGTTEYALEAMQAAARDRDFECPIEPDVVIPMVFVTDLMRGLLALQDAPESKLREPQRGYCIPGLSFSAEQLFKEIRRYKPDFKTRVKLDSNMNKFANLWPDSLSKKEPQEDLGYTPRIGLREMVAHVMIAHEERLARSRIAFRLVDEDGDGLLDKGDMVTFLNELLHVPETIEEKMKPVLVEELVARAFEDIGCADNGKISYPVFHNWTKRNTLCSMIQNFSEEKQLLI